MPHTRLSLPDFAALLVLAVEAKEVSNSELKQRHRLSIDGPKRLRLNEMKLVESRRPGRGAYLHVLTDAGWARLAEDLRAGAVPPQTGSSGAMARALLDWLPRYMERSNQSLADVFHPGDDEEEPAGVQDRGEEGDLESRIRRAYAGLAARPGAWVSLTDVRARLADAPRAAVDETLVLMERLPDVNLVPESNQKTLTEEDRAAAVLIGEQHKHLLWIGRP
ncbi:hypothetical protein AB0C27_31775 [Nonomuraea sp. NPDC048882]|uniref:hypothetical protein n=1 Tax=Nonomuraea sp. NPDC048882 TaxID=3154347 RepID=UPI0033F48305